MFFQPGNGFVLVYDKTREGFRIIFRKVEILFFFQVIEFQSAGENKFCF